MTIQSIIETKLSVLNPEYLEVLNESHKHSVPENSETHFKVTIVCNEFDGSRPVSRHQKIYQLLAEQLQQGVHALAIHAYTPVEWQGHSPESPDCLGGSK